MAIPVGGWRPVADPKMAKAPQAVEAAPQAKETIFCTASPLTALTVIVVGAGGTGARVVAPLSQMLRPGLDTLNIVDHDIVEDRNLLRQHFIARDIGRPKAAVLAERYAKRGLTTTAFARRLEHPSSVVEDALGRGNTAGIVFIGCVDGPSGRQAIHDTMEYQSASRRSSVAWIDVGNEMRGGQVLMSFSRWPVEVHLATGKSNGLWTMKTVEKAMPQMLRRQPWECPTCQIRNLATADLCKGCNRPEASCQERIDLQTVMVNHMAAGAAINCLSWLMLGIPFTSCGAFFSTLNTMQPIPIESARSDNKLLIPSTAFALTADIEDVETEEP